METTKEIFKELSEYAKKYDWITQNEGGHLVLSQDVGERYIVDIGFWENYISFEVSDYACDWEDDFSPAPFVLSKSFYQGAFQEAKVFLKKVIEGEKIIPDLKQASNVLQAMVNEVNEIGSGYNW